MTKTTALIACAFSVCNKAWARTASGQLVLLEKETEETYTLRFISADCQNSTSYTHVTIAYLIELLSPTIVRLHPQLCHWSPVRDTTFGFLTEGPIL
jgi:hypothetical protein